MSCKEPPYLSSEPCHSVRISEVDQVQRSLSIYLPWVCSKNR